MIDQVSKLAPIVALFASSLFIVERFYPLRKARYKLINRLILNLSFSFLTFAVALLVIRPAVNWLFASSIVAEWGLLNIFELNGLLRFVIAFLLLDLSFYYWHRLNHVVPLLWRLHNVHHFDGDLDVSTGARFHPVEVLLSSLFRVAQILLLGVNLFEYLFYEFFFQLATFFHHSNINLPFKLDDKLSKLVVTPKIHGIHHSNFKDETNSNYGVIFSFWDRLHCSFKYDLPVGQLVMGVPAYPAEQYTKVSKSLLAPFRKQHNYWIGADGSSHETRTKI